MIKEETTFNIGLSSLKERKKETPKTQKIIKKKPQTVGLSNLMRGQS